MTYLLLTIVILYLIISVCASAFMQMCRDRAYFIKMTNPTAGELIDLMLKSIIEGLFWPLAVMRYMAKHGKKEELGKTP